MRKFVTFGSLNEGDFFFKRGKFHCKGTVGIFQKPNDQADTTYNAFYYDGPIGKWTHYDNATLVQMYDENLHGLSVDIIRLRETKVA